VKSDEINMQAQIDAHIGIMLETFIAHPKYKCEEP
jgi:hypothetical protein